MLGDVTDLHHQWDLHQYTLRRDSMYAAQTQRDPQYWTRSGTRLPHKLHPLRTHNSSKHYIPLAERIRETAYVWDKSFAMGRNRAKGKSGHDRTTASTCADCAHPTDNMAHMLLTCTHPDIIHIREDVHQAHHNKLDKLRTRTLPHPWFYTAITKLAKAAWNPATPQVERYWTGHITATQMADAFGRHISSSLLEHQFHVLEKSIASILLPLYDGGLRMLRNRGHRHHNVDTAPAAPVPTHAKQRQPQDTHPTPKVLQLLQATSTPRTTLSARAQTRQRQAQPLRKQLLLTCGRNPTSTTSTISTTDLHSHIHLASPTLHIIHGTGPPDTLPKGRPPD